MGFQPSTASPGSSFRGKGLENDFRPKSTIFEVTPGKSQPEV